MFGWGRRGADAAETATGGAFSAQQWVSVLKAVVAELPDGRAVGQYVVDGRDPSVLSSFDGSTWWRWSAATRGLRDALRPFYAGFGSVDETVLRRWGHVLEHAHHGSVWDIGFGDLRGSRWHELMIVQACWVAAPDEPLGLTFADLVRVARVDGADAPEVVAALLGTARHARQVRAERIDGLRRLPGFAQALVEHRDVTAAALVRGTADARVAALEVVAATFDGTSGQTALAAFAGALADAATAPATQVRARAAALLAHAGEAALPPLRLVAVEGAAPQRALALELLADRPGEQEWARRTASSDRAAAVRALVERWDAAAAQPVEEPLRPEPLAPVDWAVPRRQAEAVAGAFVTAFAREAAASNARRLVSQGHNAVPLAVPTQATARVLAERLASAAAPPPGALPELAPYLAPRVLMALCVDGTLTDPVTVVTLLAASGLLDERGMDQARTLLVTLHQRTGRPDPRTTQALLDGVGRDGRDFVWAGYSRSWGPRLGRGWADAEVWPFVAEHLDWILTESPRGSWEIDDLAVFAAVATLPTRPATLVEHLFGLALGARKTLRAPAQAALGTDPRRAERAASALRDGSAEVRLVAAQWLVRLADPVALPALQAAWAKERQDVVRGAVLDALLALGERAETYLDPQATGRTAAAVVAKGLPPALAWMVWDAVPQVRWASSGQVVPTEVVQWLCATAVRARTPEPDAVLRHYAALLDPDDRQRLALYLLTAWLHEDVRPHPADVAQDNADRYAADNHFWMSMPNGPHPGVSVEQLATIVLPPFARQPAGSATASKGLLAVVAACGGRDVVGPAERYLREWYGHRPAQGKALIGMLAWVDHPAATQLVLSVGARFRTRSFQDEALVQAAALAERKGWTVDELADRTIPTGGFDEHGLLELPYGSRTFVARLLPDLTVTVRDPDGRTLKTLPPPRQADDAELVAESRKALAAAKREVRSVADLQRQRLYEALCTERTWSAEDWQRYLLRHPVVGPAVRRLVWTASDGGAPHGGAPDGGISGSGASDGGTSGGGAADRGVAGGAAVVFRPLDDGSLTDDDDEPVVLDPGARVRLAHDSVLSPEQVQRWTAHLADYEIAPLFVQLGRELHVLTEQDRARSEVADYRGHLVEAFALRNRATRLGYARGPAEDGGWFTTYVKPFPTLGITATVEFTGNSLPQENRVVALQALRFVRERSGGQGRAVLTLGEVPAVLVSETWHDLRQLAAAGTGYDPDWERKAGA